MVLGNWCRPSCYFLDYGRARVFCACSRCMECVYMYGGHNSSLDMILFCPSLLTEMSSHRAVKTQNHINSINLT